MLLTLISLAAVLIPLGLLMALTGGYLRRRPRSPVVPPPPRTAAASPSSARPLIGLGLFIGSGIAWNSGDYGLSGFLFSAFIGFMIVSLLR